MSPNSSKNSTQFKETPSESPQDHQKSQLAPSLIKVSQSFLSPHQIEKLLDLNDVSYSVFQSAKINVFELVMRASIHFRFPIRTICTTMIIFQQYYLFNKKNSYSIIDTVSACLLVASKIEDTPKRSKEFILFLNQYKGISLTTKQLEDKKMLIINIERDIFETIGFDFRHNSVQYYIIKIAKDVDLDREVARVAWIISVDGLITDLYLEIPSHTIAFACLILACKILGDTRTFPIDPVRYCSTRYKVNIVLTALCDLYLESGCKLLELRNHPDYNSHFTRRFSSTRAVTVKETAQYRGKRPNGVFDSKRAVHQRDAKMSHAGAVRYVLEWERDDVSGELLAHESGNDANASDKKN